MYTTQVLVCAWTLQGLLQVLGAHSVKDAMRLLCLMRLRTCVSALITEALGSKQLRLLNQAKISYCWHITFKNMVTLHL